MPVSFIIYNIFILTEMCNSMVGACFVVNYREQLLYNYCYNVYPITIVNMQANIIEIYLLNKKQKDRTVKTMPESLDQRYVEQIYKDI